jgi:hypothetical protein
VGRGADEDEERLRGNCRSLPGSRVRYRHRLQLPISAELHHLGVSADGDGVIAFDLIDEIPRHRLAQVVAADQQPAAHGIAREEHRRLSGRVAAADDERLPADHAELPEKRRAPWSAMTRFSLPWPWTIATIPDSIT